MRTFTAAIGLIGVLVSQAAMAQETAPPPADAPRPTTPPPADVAAAVGRRARQHRQRPPSLSARDRAHRPLRLGRPRLGRLRSRRALHDPGADHAAPDAHAVPRLLGGGVRRRHPSHQLRLRPRHHRLQLQLDRGRPGRRHDVAGLVQRQLRRLPQGRARLRVRLVLGHAAAPPPACRAEITSTPPVPPASSTRWAAASPSAPRPATSAPRAASPGCSRVDPSCRTTRSAYRQQASSAASVTTVAVAAPTAPRRPIEQPGSRRR